MIDKILKKFIDRIGNMEIEYDYPLEHHFIYEDIIETAREALEEQEYKHLSAEVKIHHMHEEVEKRLKLSTDKIKEATIDLIDKHFPKGECIERGKAMVLYAEIITTIIALQSKEEKK